MSLNKSKFGTTQSARNSVIARVHNSGSCFHAFLCQVLAGDVTFVHNSGMSAGQELTILCNQYGKHFSGHHNLVNSVSNGCKIDDYCVATYLFCFHE